MRDITVKMSHKDMYELVRDDRILMKLDREIEDAERQVSLTETVLNGDATDERRKLAQLKLDKTSRIETVFRMCLSRLDKDQLISLVMTGEYNLHVGDAEEFRKSRPPSEKTARTMAALSDPADDSVDSAMVDRPKRRISGPRFKRRASVTKKSDA